MSGAIIEGRRTPGVRRMECDVVVCGGGAGGSMAARELARAGRSVLLIEEGGDHLPADFDQREDHMFPRLFQEMGGRRTEDLAMLVMGGRGLGGSTAHNQSLCKRTPDAVLGEWRSEHGIDGVGPADMAPFFEEVERDLGVVPIADAQVNVHNALIKRGMDALGYAGGRLSHNRDAQCIGSGFCELGCAYDGKLNARRVLVPQAIAAGARIHTDARAVRIVHDGQRVSGVQAELLSEHGRVHGQLEVIASAVCLAGSAIGSPALALRSDVPDPHGTLGLGLRLHPGAVVAGVFDEPVHAWRGIPQSHDCTEFLRFDESDDRRVWLVPSFAHPAGAASLTPGFGPALMTQMRAYPRLAAIAAMVHDRTAGQVRWDGDRARIRYAPDAGDRAQLALGVREGARILFAAGARECVVSATPPLRIRSEADLAGITAERFLPHDAKLTAVHPMGTMAMGTDPHSSVTDPTGAHHQLQGLHVVDGSLFPTSIGVPPQLSIYAFAMKAARALPRGRK